MIDKLSAIRGCLLGGAIGDALGYPVEFMRWEAIQRRYGAAGIQGYERDFQEGLALVSDDTQMTLYTANGLLMCQTRRACGDGAARAEDCIFEAYLDWYHCQCSAAIPGDNRSWLSELIEMHQRRAPGNTCMSALGAGIPGSVEAPVNHSKGCGGIMRVAPIALWTAGERPVEELDMLAAQAAALTHGHSLGYMPAAALADIVYRAAWQGMDLYDAAAACRKTMRALFKGDGNLAELVRIMDLAVELSRNAEADVSNIRRIGEGWVGEEALGIALYCALRYRNDFSGAVIAAVNHSGDSDSTGAIAGNILGAALGCGAIEERWLRGLELRDVILELSDDLAGSCAVNGEGRIEDGDWRRKYSDRIA